MVERNPAIISSIQWHVKSWFIKKIPKGLWTEAIEVAVYLTNIMPSTTLKGILPFQIVAEHLDWGPKIPYVENFRVYGYKTFVLNEKIWRSDKFGSRATVVKPVGFQAQNIYRVWIPKRHKVIRNTNAAFDEECFEFKTIMKKTSKMLS